MTMSGTCGCGRFLWYNSVESVLSLAMREGKITYKEFNKYINESRPGGLLVCPNCGKRYSEEEFMELKDCVGYDAHEGCTRDPELAYQQAIARFYTRRGKSMTLEEEWNSLNYPDKWLVASTICISFFVIVLSSIFLIFGFD